MNRMTVRAKPTARPQRTTAHSVRRALGEVCNSFAQCLFRSTLLRTLLHYPLRVLQSSMSGKIDNTIPRCWRRHRVGQARLQQPWAAARFGWFGTLNRFGRFRVVIVFHFTFWGGSSNFFCVNLGEKYLFSFIDFCAFLS